MINITKKILLIGSPNCGKTTYIQTFITGNFIKDHIPTLNGTPYNIPFGTKRNVIFDIREYNILSENIYRQQWDGCIVMFDLSVRNDYLQAIETLIHLKNTIPRFKHIPIVIIGNKIDMPISMENLKVISDELEIGDVYFSMSIKNGYNIQKPYVYLSKVLFDSENV